MYGLPISTERKRQLPKKAIYAKFDLNSVQRESFDADIARIDIVAVISPVTIPALSEGTEVKEFYVLDVQMKRKEYDAKNILLLTRLIAQNMVLHCNTKIKCSLSSSTLSCLQLLGNPLSKLPCRCRGLISILFGRIL